MASNRASPSPGLSTTPSTTGTKENKKKNLAQLNINSSSATVKNAVVSDKKATKKPRLSSSDQNPVGTSDTTGEIAGENDLHSILESLQEIKQGIVTKTDISVVLKNILSELKGDFVKEIKTAIHRVPGNRNGGPRPIIVRMISPESKTLIMKHRKRMKEEFLTVDHITQQNAMLIQKLKEHELVHSAWYFNSKLFAIDKNDRRYTFDIFDDINQNNRA